MKDNRLKSAARIAGAFQIDPLVVLDATRPDWLIRAAAYEVVQADEIERRKAITRTH